MKREEIGESIQDRTRKMGRVNPTSSYLSLMTEWPQRWRGQQKTQAWEWRLHGQTATHWRNGSSGPGWTHSPVPPDEGAVIHAKQAYRTNAQLKMWFMRWSAIIAGKHMLGRQVGQLDCDLMSIDVTVWTEKWIRHLVSMSSKNTLSWIHTALLWQQKFCAYVGMKLIGRSPKQYVSETPGQSSTTIPHHGKFYSDGVSMTDDRICLSRKRRW